MGIINASARTYMVIHCHTEMMLISYRIPVDYISCPVIVFMQIFSVSVQLKRTWLIPDSSRTTFTTDENGGDVAEADPEIQEYGTAKKKI